MQIIEFADVTGTKVSFCFSEDYQFISLTRKLFAYDLPHTDDSDSRIASSEIQHLRERLGKSKERPQTGTIATKMKVHRQASDRKMSVSHLNHPVVSQVRAHSVKM